jgi:hypothetical protein
MYLTFVFYIPEDGHMIGRNMYEFIMYINQFQVQRFAFDGTVTVYVVVQY